MNPIGKLLAQTRGLAGTCDMSSGRGVKWALLLAVVLVFSVSAQEKPLTNDDVLQLSKLGLGDAVVVAKVKQAPQVDLRLDTDGLVRLKAGGVSSVVIAAMLERASSTPGPGVSGAQDTEEAIMVRVVASGKEQYLRMHRGKFVTRGFGGFANAYMNYPGLHARVRVTDSNPHLLVKSPDPIEGGRLFLVRLDSDEGDGIRSLKISSFKQRLSFKAEKALQPDKDRQIKVVISEVSDGLWKVTAAAPLPPGEYGYYVDPEFLAGCEMVVGVQRQFNEQLRSEKDRRQEGGLFDFAVDAG